MPGVISLATASTELTLHHYCCKIANKRIWPTRIGGSPGSTFHAPVTHRDKQKLYVVMNGSDFCYVGITSQPMSTRLRTGFRPNTKMGYHGYKWSVLSQVDLHIWMSTVGRDRTESIEAELVFLIRQETGSWPIYQTEIHFHNPIGATGSTDRELARGIFVCLRSLHPPQNPV